MFAVSKTKNIENGNILFDFLKGLIISMLLSFALILLFAYSMKWFSISDSFIVPATLAIKGICVVVGTFIAVKGQTKGLFKGMFFGAIYITFAFVIFSVLTGSWSLNLSSLLNFAFAVLLGGIVGIVKVNKK